MSEQGVQRAGVERFMGMAGIESGEPVLQGRRGLLQRLLAYGKRFLLPLQRGIGADPALAGLLQPLFALFIQGTCVPNRLIESPFHARHFESAEQGLALLTPIL